MKPLPPELTSYHRTPTYTVESVDPTLFSEQHRTQKGIWCEIVVVEGSLDYRILEPDFEAVAITPGNSGIVEPTILHEIKPSGDAMFYIEFYK